jgi:hypothetical protein
METTVQIRDYKKRISSGLLSQRGILRNKRRRLSAGGSLFFLLFLVACNAEVADAPPVAGDSAIIAFTNSEASADGAKLRSAGDRKADNLDAMTVYAHHSGADNFANVVATTTPNFMLGQAVSKNGNVWEYSPLKYWPANNGKVSFFAIAPAPGTENGITYISGSGYPRFTVTPVSDPAKQQDICVASAMNHTRSGGTVPFSFKHAMAKVTFASTYFNANGDKYTLKKLTLDDVYTTGTLEINAAGFTWTPTGAKGSYELLTANGHFDASTEYTTISNGKVSAKGSAPEGTLMLIPQSLSDATLVATFEVNASDIVKNVSIPLVLEAGKEYTFNVGNVDIYFRKSEWAPTIEHNEFDDRFLIANLFDDNISTPWRSADATVSQMPYEFFTSGTGKSTSFTVDMGGIKQIDGFYVHHRTDITDGPKQYFSRHIVIETSLDGTSWAQVYENAGIDQSLVEYIALPLRNTVAAKYFKVTIKGANAGASWANFSEFGAYNAGELGPMATTPPTGTLVSLTNTTRPFIGDNAPSVRWQKLYGWSCIPSNLFTNYDADPNNNSMVMFSDLNSGGYGNNFKVWQEQTLPAGSYTLSFLCNRMDGGAGVNVYGVVTTQSPLPDYDNVPSSGSTLGCVLLSELPIGTRTISFTVPAGGADITIGWVYNTYDPPLHNYAWMGMDGIELRKTDGLP